ncbi:nucleoside-diphosphate sugar epimerase [Paenibacillus sp. HJGM_3]|uniref:nucleoside-diphosphate sugar epimerase n=1 Tax=Paenibacillus sp. HJGM_3 TaxID=3379816 RepID=UPI00385CF2F0
MQKRVTSIIGHMAKSHMELARILEAKRLNIVNTAHVIGALPNTNLQFDGAIAVGSQAIDIAKSVSQYLTSLADLEEAIAENLEVVIKELTDGEEEE